MVTLSESVGFGKRVVSDFSEKNVTFLAAALAYHAFISLAPMLLLGFFLLTTVGTEWGALLVQAAGRWLPGPIAEVVTQLFQRSPDGTGASIIGVLVLLWGTLKIFGVSIRPFQRFTRLATPTRWSIRFETVSSSFWHSV